jgi:ectoine hydroxylase-related dioxygenase (phytanoyl-CoA dioxygenase family)
MFINENISTSIKKLGFARLSGFSNSTLDKLQTLYTHHFRQLHSKSDLTVTHNLENVLSPLQIHESISKIVGSDLNKLLKGHRIFASHFAVKKAGSEGSFQLHQDWSITDENNYQNFQIWIPLITSYPENGGLCFIPESHNFFSNLRSGSLSIPRIPIIPEVYPYLSYCRLMKGEAVAFYPQTLHGSFINSSPEDRVGVILNIIEVNAPTYYFHQINDSVIEKHAFDASLLFAHLPVLEKGKLPFNQLISIENIYQKSNNELNFEDLFNEITKAAKEKNRALEYEHKETTILRNEELEIQINKNGFAIIEFLTPKEIELLKIEFGKFFPDRSVFSGSFSSMSVLENEQCKKAHKIIQVIIQEKLELFFKDFECPISLFYSRRPDAKNKLDWHSDPAFNFNEHLVPIYGIWCPLQAVNQTCGGLKIIPGGHRIIPKLNLSFAQWKWPLDDYRELLNNYGKSVELEVGQALIYDTRMIHASDPNYSDFERDNVVMRILPENSNYFKFIRSNKNGGHVYKVPSNHFFTESAKNHQLSPEDNEASDYMFTFEYELTKSEIENYFSNF